MMKGYSRSLYRVETLYPGKQKLHHKIQKYKSWNKKKSLFTFGIHFDDFFLKTLFSPQKIKLIKPCRVRHNSEKY